MNRSIAKRQLRVAKTMKKKEKKGTKHITSKIAKAKYCTFRTKSIERHLRCSAWSTRWRKKYMVKKSKVWASLSLIRSPIRMYGYGVCLCRCIRERETAEPHSSNETRQSTFMNATKRVSNKNMLMANGSINAVTVKRCLASRWSVFCVS